MTEPIVAESAWSKLTPDLIRSIAHRLHPNDVVSGLSLVNSDTAAVLRMDFHTLQLADTHRHPMLRGVPRAQQPWPGPAFVAHWGCPEPWRSLGLPQRRRLLCLAASSGHAASLDAALAHCGCSVTAAAVEAAGAAGQADALGTLLRGMRAEHMEWKADPLAPALQAAAISGNQRAVEDTLRFVEDMCYDDEDDQYQAALCAGLLECPAVRIRRKCRRAAAVGACGGGHSHILDRFKADWADDLRAWRKLPARMARAAAASGHVGVLDRLAPRVVRDMRPGVLVHIALGCPLETLVRYFKRWYPEPGQRHGAAAAAAAVAGGGGGGEVGGGGGGSGGSAAGSGGGAIAGGGGREEEEVEGEEEDEDEEEDEEEEEEDEPDSSADSDDDEDSDDDYDTWFDDDEEAVVHDCIRLASRSTTPCWRAKLDWLLARWQRVMARTVGPSVSPDDYNIPDLSSEADQEPGSWLQSHADCFSLKRLRHLRSLGLLECWCDPSQMKRHISQCPLGKVALGAAGAGADRKVLAWLLGKCRIGKAKKASRKVAEFMDRMAMEAARGGNTAVLQELKQRGMVFGPKHVQVRCRSSRHTCKVALRPCVGWGGLTCVQAKLVHDLSCTACITNILCFVALGP